MSDQIDEPYPFESDDDIEIGELDLDSVDAFEEASVTVSQLVGENESWRFGHVIVDEAQDLTPMQWRMVMRRVRGRSLTIVGDLAQRAAGATESWNQLLPSELDGIERRDLSINYRSPAEIHAVAVQVLESFAPDVAPSRPIRRSGFEPSFVEVADLDTGVAEAVTALRSAVAGQIAVITVSPSDAMTAKTAPGGDGDEVVRLHRPDEVKGLEFDGVVLVEPAAILALPGGASLLYVALTRATQRLVIVHRRELPTILKPA